MIDKVYIKQGGVETPSFETIDEQYEFAHKLAEIADNVSEDSYIEAKVFIPFCSPSDKEKVNARFGDVLSIDERLVQFEDKEVARVVINDIFNNSNVLITDLNNKSSFSLGYFRLNEKIKHFPEFRYFTKLTSLPYTATTNLTDANLGCFGKCINLEDIILPDSLTSLSKSTFAYCSNLRTINLDNVKSLDWWCFLGTTSLSVDIRLPYLTSIGSRAFQESGITKILDLGSITAIPNGVGNNTSTYNGVFSRCPNLTEAVLPSSLITLGSMCFYESRSLEKVDFNHAACSIGERAFAGGIESLHTLLNSENITSIEQCAFYGCSSLAIDINMPNLSGTLSAGAFQNSGIVRISDLGNVSVISGTSTSASAFAGCKNLVYANFPSTLTAIQTASFYNCNALEYANLNGSSCSIGGNAFQNTTSLKKIEGTENITSISGNATFESSGIEEINLGKIERIDSGNATSSACFSRCVSLKKVILPESCNFIGSYAFSGDISLTDIDLRHVNSFGRQTFSNCYALPIARLDSVVDAGTYLFSGGAEMSLKLCLIGENCVSVGLQSFNRCNHVKVVCKAVTPPTCGAAIFTYCSGNDYGIYVPDGSVDDYKAAAGWSAYASRINGFEEVESFPSDADTSKGYLTSSSFYYHNGEDWMMVDIETGSEHEVGDGFFENFDESDVVLYDVLTGDGKSYIEVGNFNSSYTYNIEVLNVPNYSDVFGTRKDYGSGFYAVGSSNSTSISINYGNNIPKNFGGFEASGNIPMDITVNWSDGIMSAVNGSKTLNATFDAVAENTTGGAVRLFGVGGSYGTSIKRFSIRKFSITDADGVKLNDSRPAVFGDMAGLYDSASRRFYFNKNSEGSFAISNDNLPVELAVKLTATRNQSGGYGVLADGTVDVLGGVGVCYYDVAGVDYIQYKSDASLGASARRYAFYDSSDRLISVFNGESSGYVLVPKNAVTLKCNTYSNTDATVMGITLSNN